MSAIDVYLGNNAKYAAGRRQKELPRAPSRCVAIVACMDARLETGALLGLEEGEAHVIRNAGGVVTDDVIRSLAVSQNLLGTREIMLIQHTDCGMQAADDAAMREAIEERTGEAPPFELGTFADLEQAVREGIAQLRASPLLRHRDAVRGFVYEVETGRLREIV
jgi:carbonic anhydrase